MATKRWEKHGDECCS